MDVCARRSRNHDARLSKIILIWLCFTQTFAHFSCSKQTLSTEEHSHSQTNLNPKTHEFYEFYAQLLVKSHRAEGMCYQVIQKLLHQPQSIITRHLERLRPELPAGLTPHQELAYWINAYNFLMLLKVAQYWPIQSVKGAIKGDDSYAIFKEHSFTVAGKKRSLDEIEHQIIRPRFADPRIHAALNCASRSCPPLATIPYAPTQLDQQLNEVTRSFILDPSRQRLDHSPPILSMIFKWYADDFKNGGGVKRWLAHYMSEPMRSRFLDDSKPLEYLNYDWSLNEAPMASCQVTLPQ